MQTDANPKTVRVLMWNVSSHWADVLFDVSNVVLIIGALAVFVGTYGAIAMGSAKERFAETRISENEKETKRAVADSDLAKEGAAKANERAAELEKEAAVARLALERLKAPRTLGADRQAFVTGVTRAFRGQKYRAAISTSADDGLQFWASLHAALDAAGWVYVSPGPHDVTLGSPPAGTPVVSMPGVEIKFDPSMEKELVAPALALGNALHADGMVVVVNRDNPTANNPDRDTLFIVIGARVPPP